MRAAVSLVLCLMLAGPCLAQNGGRDAAPAGEEPWDPEKALRQARTVPGLRQVDELPADLRGQAAVFPIGDPKNDLRAALYVPSYYDAARTWPVLVEGNFRGHLPVAVHTFAPQAEKHGFILLAVEYLFHQGQESGSFDAWSREGDITVKQHSRRVDEFLADMAVDERVLLDVLKTLREKYSVERRATGATGFLGAAVMAFRLPMSYPDLFCGGIARSGGFEPLFMPTPAAKARDSIYYIVFGEKEDARTLKASEDAIEYLKARKFTRCVAERIPNSGVDSRPEITANYFRSAVDELLGPDRAAFDRAANLAGLCLLDRLPADTPTADGRPADPRSVAASLESFLSAYPRSANEGMARFLLARLLAEKLSDKPKAAETLREFDKRPLMDSPAAPPALVYLVEHLLDTDADAKEATRLLKRARSRPRASAEVKARADDLLKELSRKLKDDAN